MDLFYYKRAAFNDIRYVAEDAYFLSWVSGLPKEILVLIIEKLVIDYKKILRVSFEIAPIIPRSINCKVRKSFIEWDRRKLKLEAYHGYLGKFYYVGDYDLLMEFKNEGIISNVRLLVDKDKYNVDDFFINTLRCKLPLFGIC